MTLQQLTYLVTVAECGNITEAAEKLYVSQPSLSVAIHTLEKEMGVTAFIRSNKGVVTTREGERNSFYFAEEFVSMLDFPKNIQVRDRATLFNLLIGLNGFTVSSGVIDQRLNGKDIIARPLEVSATMRIGIIKKKNMINSRYASSYVDALKNHLSIG